MSAFIALLCLVRFTATQGDLLHQIIPSPTGQNGYEEYLRAADIVSADQARLFLRWQSGDDRRLEQEAQAGNDPASRRDANRLLPLARRLGSLTVLERRREAVSKFGEALDWVKRGNEKPLLSPRPQVRMDTRFPELSRFWDLALLAKDLAYVRDAEGRSLQATAVLMDAVEMGDRIGALGSNLFLYGVVMQQIALGAMDSRLDRLSSADAKGIADRLSKILENPPTVQSALARDSAARVSMLRDWLAKLDTMSPEAAAEDPLLDAAQKLGQAERSRLMLVLEKRVASLYGGVLQDLSGPESVWVRAELEQASKPDLRSVEGIADAILAGIGPVWRLGRTAATMRTQLRLLRLAARVVIFKWENERLPTRLEDAAPASEIADPLTGDSFQYTPMSDHFRVFSKGVPGTGEIDIKYVRGQGTGGPPPPFEG